MRKVFLYLSLPCLLLVEVYGGLSIMPGITVAKVDEAPGDDAFVPLTFENDFFDARLSDADEHLIEISEEAFRDIGSASDLNAALEALLGPGTQPKLEETIPHMVAPRLGSIAHREPEEPAGDGLLRSNKIDKFLSNPSQALCDPELKAVDLGLTSTSAVTYYPTCIRLMQCGGCCPKKGILSCQPVASKKVVVQVLELLPQSRSNRIRGGGRRRGGAGRRRNSVRLQYNRLNVTMEEHTECSCQCQLRESECNLAVHNYNQDTCSCSCKKADEEAKCFLTNTHSWNKRSCKCLCRDTMQCSSSEEFDHSTCECKSIKSLNFYDFKDLIYDVNLGRSVSKRIRKPVSVPIRMV